MPRKSTIENMKTFRLFIISDNTNIICQCTNESIALFEITIIKVVPLFPQHTPKKISYLNTSKNERIQTSRISIQENLKGFISKF